MNIFKKAYEFLVYDVLYKISIFNWVRYRIWNRHHVLKMRYLEPGWHDKDRVLIHAMFETLCRFIEDEKPGEIVNWESDPEHKHAWEEMNSLYKWWTGERQERDDKNPIFQPDVHPPTMKFEDEDPKKDSYKVLKFVHKSDEEKAKWEKACDESTNWEIECDKEDKRNMIRLIEIYRYMWC